MQSRLILDKTEDKTENGNLSSILSIAGAAYTGFSCAAVATSAVLRGASAMSGFKWRNHNDSIAVLAVGTMVGVACGAIALHEYMENKSVVNSRHRLFHQNQTTQATAIQEENLNTFSLSS